MGIRESYEHGVFSWVDYSAHDFEVARKFYQGLFGWTSVDVDTQGGPPYAQFHLDGKMVCGLGAMPEEMKSQGIPPMWSSYINVDDAEAVSQKVVELGGQMTMPIMQILDYGWMSFLQDPEGAHVGIWQKNTHIGAEVVNSPGAFCWNELATRNPDAEKTFFANLFGWEYEDNPDGQSPYWIIKSGERQNGGIIEMTEEWGEMPPHWMVYFNVEDIAASLKKLEELGGSVCVPPFDLAVGRMSVVTDPQGGTFTLIQLIEWDD